MRTTFRKTLTAFFLILIYSCTGGDSPKSVAENFLKAMNQYDFETAKKYGTEDTGKLLDMMSGFSKMMPDSARNEEKYEMTGENIEGEKATVTYKIEGRDENGKLELVKVNGKWKVAMSKDSINDDETNAMDSGATSTDTVGVEGASSDTSMQSQGK